MTASVTSRIAGDPTSTAGEEAKAEPAGQLIQQAKKTDTEPQILQIVAAPNRADRHATAKLRPQPKLTRVPFRVSRLMEFCSERELQNQTGHAVEDWPLVVLKEGVDNALDACEEAEIAPVITVIVEADKIIIQDNAGGIDAATITSIFDYTVRVSSREAYVSPTRGAHGNALKTILAMGYVLQGASGGAVGVTIFESRGIAHRIEFRADHVNNEPVIRLTTEPSAVTAGTRLTIHWPRPHLLEWAEDRFKQLIEDCVWFNPHLTVRGSWNGCEFINVAATNPTWDKWRPRDPTSAHWYDTPRLQRYLAAHVARDRDLGQRRTVREFIAEFRGLSSTTRQRLILDEVGCSHQSLASFFGNERVNQDGIVKLLAAMRKHSRPVTPKSLGIIGAEHFKARVLAAGGQEETFKYQCRKGFDSNNIPYVVEFGFGVHRSGLNGADDDIERKLITGANWSAAIVNPFRRFGTTGAGVESVLTRLRVHEDEPVIVALHLASASIQYADRGKSSIILHNAEVPTDD
jgi:DNA topoisomerase VI subunit B